MTSFMLEGMDLDDIVSNLSTLAQVGMLDACIYGVKCYNYEVNVFFHYGALSFTYCILGFLACLGGNNHITLCLPNSPQSHDSMQVNTSLCE